MSALVIALSIAGFVVVACMRVSDPLLPLIAEDFGVSVGQAGSVVTAYAVAYGLFLLAYGPLGDRYGKLKVIAVTLTAASVCVTACAFADSLPMLATLRFLTGVTSAATVPLAIAWIGDNVPFEHRQKSIARYMSGIIFGQMLGSALGGVLSDRFGWRAIFLVFGAATALVAILVWSRVRSEVLALAPRSPLRQAGQRYVELLRNPRVADVLTSGLVEGFCVFGALAYVGALLHGRHGLSFTLVGLALLAYGVGGLVYAASAPAILRHLGQRGMIAFGGVIMAWSLVAIGCSPSGTSFGLFAFALFAGQALGVTAIGWLVDREGYTLAIGLAGLGVGLLGLWMQGSPVVPRRQRR